MFCIHRRDFQSLCVRVYNLRSCQLRLTFGRAPLCSLVLFCLSQHRWLNAIGQRRKFPLVHWPSLDLHVIGTGHSEPQLNLRWTSGKHLLDAGSIAAVDHGDEGVPAARPRLQLPGHGLVPAHTQSQISQLSYYLRTFPPHGSRTIPFNEPVPLSFDSFFHFNRALAFRCSILLTGIKLPDFNHRFSRGWNFRLSEATFKLRSARNN